MGWDAALQVGVALLGGFGDLNADRKQSGAGADKAGGSTALALSSWELTRLRVPELKKKLKEAGVDLRRHPEAVEKKASRSEA